jgi:hypothetical protein
MSKRGYEAVPVPPEVAIAAPGEPLVFPGSCAWDDLCLEYEACFQERLARTLPVRAESDGASTRATEVVCVEVPRSAQTLAPKQSSRRLLFEVLQDLRVTTFV